MRFSCSSSYITLLPINEVLVLFLWRTAHMPRDFSGGTSCKELPANAGAIRGTNSTPGLGRSPEEGRAHHSNILAWRILRTEEPGGLQSTGSQIIGHNRSDLAHTNTKTTSSSLFCLHLNLKFTILFVSMSTSQWHWISFISKSWHNSLNIVRLILTGHLECQSQQNRHLTHISVKPLSCGTSISTSTYLLRMEMTARSSKDAEQLSGR